MRVVLIFIIIFSVFSCAKNIEAGCDSDAECREGRTCQDRVCTGEIAVDTTVDIGSDDVLADTCEKNIDCDQQSACAETDSGSFACVPASDASGTGELRDNDCGFSWDFPESDERAKMSCSRVGDDSFSCECSHIVGNENFTGSEVLPAADTCEFLAAEDFMNRYCSTKFHGSFGVFAP